MAKKKYHLTPDGAKQCRAAHVDKCPYRLDSPHFDTEAEALAADAKVQNYKERKKRTIELQRKIDQKHPDDVFTGYLNVHQDDALRTFAEDVQAYHSDPIAYRMHTKTALENGAFSPVEMTLTRNNKVNMQTGEVEGIWVLKTYIAHDEENDFASTTENTEFHFDDTNANATWQKLHRTIKRNAYRSGLDPEDGEEEIDAQTNWHYNNFKNIIDSVETEASGAFRSWENGTGHFAESDPETIRVDTTFSGSSFRGEHVHEFLAENPIFSTTTPDIDIRVAEYAEDGSGWELNMNDGYSWITLQDKNGHVVEEDILADDESYYRMYLASRDILDRHETETERHAEYALNLVKEVNAAVKAHPQRIQEYWEQEKQIRASRDENFVHDVLNKDRDKNSTIDKIFGLFK